MVYLNRGHVMRRTFTVGLAVAGLALGFVSVAAPAQAVVPDGTDCRITILTPRLVLAAGRRVDARARLDHCPAGALGWASYIRWEMIDQAGTTSTVGFNYEPRAVFPDEGLTRQVYNAGVYVAAPMQQDDWMDAGEPYDTHYYALTVAGSVTAKFVSTVKVRRKGARLLIKATRDNSAWSAPAARERVQVLRDGKPWRRVRLSRDGTASLRVAGRHRWRVLLPETASNWAA